MIRLIIFDLDETLVRSRNLYKKFASLRTNDVKNRFGITQAEAERRVALLRSDGISNYQLYEQLGLEEGCVKGGELLRKRTLDVDPSKYIVPDAELGRHLFKLKEDGLLLVLVTETLYELALKQLDAARIPKEAFCRIVGWEMGKSPPKSNGNAHSTFSSILAELGVGADETIAVGNEPKLDLAALKNMGATTILVGQDKYLRADDCKYVDLCISDIHQLDKAIEQIRHHSIKTRDAQRKKASKCKSQK